MKPVAEIRLANLERLIKDKNSLQAVASAAKTSSVYLSQIRNQVPDVKTGKPRSMGNDMARRLEVACGKPENWMDTDHSVVYAAPPGRNSALHVAEREVIDSLYPMFVADSSVDELQRLKDTDRRLVGKVVLTDMGAKASMGRGVERPSHEEIVMTMVVDESWLRRRATFSSKDQLALVQGIGDSMFPTFEDGDPLLVDRSVTEIKLDAVYVLALNDELYIKRIQRRPDGTLVMISDNKAYEPYPIKDTEREKFEVLGRVVMVWNSKRI